MEVQDTTIILTDKICDTQSNQILSILIKYDNSFVPPLSTRDGTCQIELHTTLNKGILGYFNELQDQNFVLAIDNVNNKVIGFLSYRYNYTPDILRDKAKAKIWLYITTIIVENEYRRHGIAYNLYAKLIESYTSDSKIICTRTWSTNRGHIKLLQKEEFSGPIIIKNDRALGIDTVYYYKKYNKND